MRPLPWLRTRLTPTAMKIRSRPAVRDWRGTGVARRYGNHRWIPYVAYGAAALVGFSRLSLSAHFLSDVFVGGCEKKAAAATSITTSNVII
jgi:membrane-associated phospholipid phosphatase